MRILTNISKAELEYLTNQPTAKELIQKVKNEGIYIPEGDVQGAADFVAKRKQELQDSLLQISDEGMAALKKQKEDSDQDVQDVSSKKDQLKEEISKLQKELAKIKAKQSNSEEQKKLLDNKVNALSQQISALSMQLIQMQKNDTE